MRFLSLYSAGPSFIANTQQHQTPPSILAGHNNRLRRALGYTLLAAFSAFWLPGAPAAANDQPIRWLGDNGLELGPSLQIGDSLHIGFTDVPALSILRLQVLDGSRQLVIEREVSSDANGAIPIELLWHRTGVVGCQEPATQLGDYQFRRFEDADPVLRDRGFLLRLVNSQGVLSRRRLNLESRTDPLFYFADSTGCPRRELHEGEDLYLAGSHLPSGSPVTVFLVDGTTPLVNGDPLGDVRLTYATSPHQFVLADSETSFLELLWPGIEVAIGTYTGVVRLTSDPSPWPFLSLEDYQLLIQGREDGIQISPWPVCDACS